MTSGIRRGVSGVFLGILLVVSSNASGGGAQLEMRVVDEYPLVVGQIVTVELSLRSESPIVGAAKFALPELEFGVWLEQSRTSYNGFALRDGRRVPTLVTSYAVWLQKVGRFQLPGVQVTAPVLIDGTRSDLEAAARGLSLSIQYPRVDPQPKDFLVAHEAQMSSFLDLPTELHPGQIIEQTLTIRAQGALPVSFPDVDVMPSKAYKVDRLPVDSSVDYTRGVVSSTQVVTLRYTLLESGRQMIPSYSLDWWNTDLHQFQTLRSKPYEIQVNASDVVDDGSSSKMAPFWLWGILPGLVLAWTVVNYWRPMLIACKRLRSPVLPERLNP
ncbi:MAG: hypothetical protein ACPG6R_08665 [Aequoribacter sp.]|uniref:hypothetical protein n=3 Tax=Aequoribacter sp. TaxID=2847771 RepID=UPI003C3BC3B9